MTLATTPAQPATQPATEPGTDPASRTLRHVGWTVLAVSVSLSLLSIALPAFVNHPLFLDRGAVRLYTDVNEEANLPTWWSSALLVTGALAHLVVALVARTSGAAGAWRWLVSAAVVGGLSLDDHTQLHERLNGVGAALVDLGTWPFMWMVPAAGLAAGIVAVLVALAVQLRGWARLNLVLGGVLLVSAALTGELVQGMLLLAGEHGPVYALTVHGEEFCENLGAIALIAAALQALRVRSAEGRLSVSYTGGV